MAADTERIKLINTTAKELLKDRSEITDEISVHVRLLNSRWENVQDLAKARRIVLDNALRIHQFQKDAEDIASRMQEKVNASKI